MCNKEHMNVIYINSTHTYTNKYKDMGINNISKNTTTIVQTSKKTKQNKTKQNKTKQNKTKKVFVLNRHLLLVL